MPPQQTPSPVRQIMSPRSRIVGRERQQFVVVVAVAWPTIRQRDSLWPGRIIQFAMMAERFVKSFGQVVQSSDQEGRTAASGVADFQAQDVFGRLGNQGAIPALS